MGPRDPSGTRTQVAPRDPSGTRPKWEPGPKWDPAFFLRANKPKVDSGAVPSPRALRSRKPLILCNRQAHPAQPHQPKGPSGTRGRELPRAGGDASGGKAEHYRHLPPPHPNKGGKTQGGKPMGARHKRQNGPVYFVQPNCSGPQSRNSNDEWSPEVRS